MAVGLVQPFQPIQGGTVALTPGTTSTNVALPSGGESVLVTNASTVTAFVRVDGPGAVATLTDVPLAAGARLMLNAGTYATTAAVIASSTGTGSVYFTRGSGTAY